MKSIVVVLALFTTSLYINANPLPLENIEQLYTTIEVASDAYAESALSELDRWTMDA